jgi:hypothetical protein
MSETISEDVKLAEEQGEQKEGEGAAEEAGGGKKLGFAAPGPIGTLNGPSPIPGLKISSIGGLVGFCPCGGNAQAIGTPNTVPEFAGSISVPLPPTANATNYMDVLNWDAGPRMIFDDATDTGSRAVARIPVIEDWEADIVVMNDARISPIVLARWGLVGAGVVAQGNFSNVGVRMTLIHGNPQNYPTPNIDGTLITPDFYYSPCAQLVTPSVRIDPQSKKMVITRFKMISGGAPLYHLPYAAKQLAADIVSWNGRYKGF